VTQKSDREFFWTREGGDGTGYYRGSQVKALAMVQAGESAREAARLLNVGASLAFERHKQWLPDLVAKNRT
jgi:hypothetical protein